MRTERYKLIHFYGEGGLAGATNPLQRDTATAESKLLHQYAASGRMGNDPKIDCDELYDLLADPAEMNNLAGDKGYEKTLQELKAQLTKYRKELKVPEY